MIPDLLHRLETMAKTANAADAMMMREAIGEIENLREGVRKLETVHRQRNQWGDLMMAENERLREALCDAMQYLYDMGDFDKADEVRAALGEGKE